MRKFIIVLAMANGIASMCYGQGFIRMNINQPAPLAAFAGSDTLVCSNHPVILGGSPSATGGNHSYVYLWSPADGLNDRAGIVHWFAINASPGDPCKTMRHLAFFGRMHIGRVAQVNGDGHGRVGDTQATALTLSKFCPALRFIKIWELHEIKWKIALRPGFAPVGHEGFE